MWHRCYHVRAHVWLIPVQSIRPNYCFEQFASNEAFFCSDLNFNERKTFVSLFYPRAYVWYLNVRHCFIHVSTSTNMTWKHPKSQVAHFLSHLDDGAVFRNAWSVIQRVFDFCTECGGRSELSAYFTVIHNIWLFFMNENSAIIAVATNRKEKKAVIFMLHWWRSEKKSPISRKWVLISNRLHHAWLWCIDRPISRYTTVNYKHIRIVQVCPWPLFDKLMSHLTDIFIH